MSKSTESPMLAASLPSIKKAKALGRSPTPEETMADLRKLQITEGFLISPKIDGIRCIIKDGVALSRTYKPIPNIHVQHHFGRAEFEGLDGELTFDHHAALRSYNDNQSAIMTADGPSNIFFNVFDMMMTPVSRFFHRTEKAKEVVEKHLRSQSTPIVYVEHQKITTIEELFESEEHVVSQGYEGLMLRHPNGLYKTGRSTFIEQGLIKLKRFEDGEAEIIGFVELKRNTNEPTIDARGFQVRSAHLAGKVGADTLGLFKVRDLVSGTEFECGSGLDDATREKVWINQSRYLGQIIKYKSQPHGVKEKPRSPIFLGFRTAEDI